MGRRLQKSTKHLALAVFLVPGAATECSDCAGTVIEQLAQTPGVGAGIGMFPGLRLGSVVATFRFEVDRCPRSRNDLLGAFRTEDRDGIEGILEGFRDVSLSANPSGSCIVSYTTKGQTVSKALGAGEEKPDFDPRVRPQRGVVELGIPLEEEGVLKTPFKIAMYEETGLGSTDLEERTLRPLSGRIERNRESGKLNIAFDDPLEE
ncbi:MAG: hypothetical protein OEM05_07150 [Myxococcales bacterium]|nr:hypothetical protein [Myxococcales bacterium]